MAAATVRVLVAVLALVCVASAFTITWDAQRTTTNSYRAAVSPAASPALHALTWSNSLQTTAQNWANGCHYAHSGTGPENIYASASSSWTTTPPADSVLQSSYVNAATSWWNENAAYNIAGACSSGNVCGTCTPTAAIPECGHYTQMAWGAATQLGCGAQYCTTNSPFSGYSNWFFVVCRYDIGNIIGQYPYTRSSSPPPPPPPSPPPPPPSPPPPPPPPPSTPPPPPPSTPPPPPPSSGALPSGFSGSSAWSAVTGAQLKYTAASTAVTPLYWSTPTSYVASATDFTIAATVSGFNTAGDTFAIRYRDTTSQSSNTNYFGYISALFTVLSSNTVSVQICYNGGCLGTYCSSTAWASTNSIYVRQTISGSNINTAVHINNAPASSTFPCSISYFGWTSGAASGSGINLPGAVTFAASKATVGGTGYISNLRVETASTLVARVYGCSFSTSTWTSEMATLGYSATTLNTQCSSKRRAANAVSSVTFTMDAAVDMSGTTFGPTSTAQADAFLAQVAARDAAIVALGVDSAAAAEPAVDAPAGTTAIAAGAAVGGTGGLGTGGIVALAVAIPVGTSLIVLAVLAAVVVAAVVVAKRNSNDSETTREPSARPASEAPASIDEQAEAPARKSTWRHTLGRLGWVNMDPLSNKKKHQSITARSPAVNV